MMPWLGPSMATKRRTMCMRLVLPHPFARERHAQAVADDVHALRAREVHHRAHEAAQVGHVGRVGVGDARAARLVGGQVALVALVAHAPELAGGIAVVGEELRQRLDAPVGAAGGGERRVVVAVDEDDRRSRHRAGGAEADERRRSEVSSIEGKPGGSVLPTMPAACAPSAAVTKVAMAAA